MNREEFIVFLIENQARCGTCWWREGFRCYHEGSGSKPGVGVEITADIWAACNAAGAYENERAVLMRALPQVLLKVAEQTQPEKAEAVRKIIAEAGI